jgi:hypothetical protein
MTSVVLKPPTEARRRQQDPCSANSCAATWLKALLRRPRYYLYRARDAPPTATLLSVQGSGHFPASHVSFQLHPHCTAGHLLMSIKGGVQGPTKEEGGRGTGRERVTHDKGTREDRHGLTLSLSRSLLLALPLSLSRNTCNPYYEHPGAK